MKHEIFFQNILSNSEIKVTSTVGAINEDEFEFDPAHINDLVDDNMSSKMYPSLAVSKSYVPKSRLFHGVDFLTFIGDHLHSSDLEILKLASSLWDPISFGTTVLDGLTLAQKNAVEAAIIKTRVSEWLAVVVKPQVDFDLSKCKGVSQVFHHLTGRNISKAVVEAIKNRDFRLATILSQIGGSGSQVAVQDLLGNLFCANGAHGRGGTDFDTLNDIIAQVLLWNDSKKSGKNAVEDDYLAIWNLLGGCIDNWDETILQPSFDWKRTFALFFWYAEGGALSLSESIERYELNFADNAFHPPHAYLNSNFKDTQFQLLKLATDNRYSLEAAIHPLGQHRKLLDSRTSWLLGEMLTSVKGIRSFGDTVMEVITRTGDDGQSVKKTSNDRRSLTADRMTLDVIFQLESLQLWKWAVFLATYLSTHSAREKTIKSLITKYYPLQGSAGSWKVLEDEPINSFSLIPLKVMPEQSSYKFLTEIVFVPAIWIHEARALKAGYLGNFIQQTISLIDAKEFGHAHRLLFSRIIPQNLISGINSLNAGHFELVREYLEQIPPNSTSGWEYMGGLVLQYLDVMEFASDPSEEQLELQVQIIQILKSGIATKWIQSCRLDASKTDSIRWIKVCITHMATRMLELVLPQHKVIAGGIPGLKEMIPLVAQEKRLPFIRDEAVKWILGRG